MYEVGQVLSVVLSKRPQIVPVQVIEQVVRRSLKGEEIQYSVNVPTKDGDKTFELSGLDGTVYSAIDDLKEAMLANAKSTILEMTDRALKVAQSRFDYSEDSLVRPPSPIPASNSEEAVKITLDDGVVANVVLPEEIAKDIL